PEHAKGSRYQVRGGTGGAGELSTTQQGDGGINAEVGRAAGDRALDHVGHRGVESTALAGVELVADLHEGKAGLQEGQGCGELGPLIHLSLGAGVGHTGRFDADVMDALPGRPYYVSDFS